MRRPRCRRSRVATRPMLGRDEDLIGLDHDRCRLRHGSCTVTEKSDDSDRRRRYTRSPDRILQPRSAGEVLQRRFALEVQPEADRPRREPRRISPRSLIHRHALRCRGCISCSCHPSPKPKSMRRRRGIELLDRDGITLGRAHADRGVRSRISDGGGGRNRRKTKEGARLEDLADERTLIRRPVVDRHGQLRAPRRIENRGRRSSARRPARSGGSSLRSARWRARDGPRPPRPPFRA